MDIASFCHWDTAKFLFISGNVFDPLIYYSHFSSLLLSGTAGLFVFTEKSNTKGKGNCEEPRQIQNSGLRPLTTCPPNRGRRNWAALA